MQKQLFPTLAIALLSVAMVRAVAPDPPQSLTANVSGNTVTLTWLPAPTGGVPASYVIEAALSPGGPTFATLDVVGTGVVVNTVGTATYYVRVRAVNFDGTSGQSNEVVVVVPSTGCSGPPEAPTNLTSSVFGMLVGLNWTPPPVVCPGTGYMLQVGSAPGLTDLGVINHGPTTAFVATAPAGTYYVRVAAVNALGVSAPSNEVVIDVSTGPPNLAGRWSGTSNYFNAPFTFDLTQNGSQIGGRYSDQHDQGFVSGVVNISSVILDVNFGDTGIRFEGSIENANRIRGLIRGSVIGGPYNFEMTR